MTDNSFPSDLENDLNWLRMDRDSWKQLAEMANERADRNLALAKASIVLAEKCQKKYLELCEDMKAMLT